MNFSPYISISGASLVALVVAAQPTIVWALEATQINEIAKNITVRIEIDNGTNIDHGSGVIIARDDSSYYVLTSQHVVKYLDYAYKIHTPDGDSYDLDNNRIKYIDNVDLAVISFKSDRQYKVAQIESSAERITPGISVYVNGFPKAGREIQDGAQFTSGSLTGINEQHSSGYNLIYNNFTRGGMSGGPVLNGQGKLIGIHGLAEQEAPEIAAENDCETAETEESSRLPTPIGSTDNEARNNCNADSNQAPEKIDLNLGISILTFMERAATIGMDQVLDTTSSTTPTRTPRISPTSDPGSGCSGVICP